LKDSVERLLADHYGFEARRGYGAEAPGFSAAMWRRYADLGLLALPFPEASGGIGGGPVDVMIVMEAFGGALILEPYFATVILAGGLLRHLPGPEAEALIGPVAAGELRLAVALAEPQARYDLTDVETMARRDGDGWVISGRKALVLHGDSADKLLVVARTGGGVRDTEGLSVFVVEDAAEGLSRQGYPTQDGLRAADLILDAVRVGPEALIGPEGGAGPAVLRVADEAVAALCAEAVGVMARMQALTLEYLKTREQFGTTIGAFQALQHRAAEMFVELEQSRSMVLYATMLAGSEDAAARAAAVSAAKVQIGEAGKLIGREAVQMHGGIGMTMEHPIGHYFKRATMLDLLFGDADYHLDRLAGLGGLIGEG
jgi:pimeloyl-CoA dehydrogenase small subunit